MVEELLDFSKFVSGRIKLEYEEVDLAGLLSDIRKQFMMRAVRENIDFTVNCGKDLPDLKTDGNRLKQLFINIMIMHSILRMQGDLFVLKLKYPKKS